MPKSIKKRTSVQQAMAALRKQMGWTQAKLAEILRVQLPSVGRWETTEPPTGVSLARLHRIAAREGASKLAKVFWRALEQEGEGRPDTADMILEIYTWSELGYALSDLDADIRKLETEQLKDSGLTNQIKMHAETLNALCDKIRYLRWREKEKLGR
jgi:transcriptional regulator with XRE-family HTH domain